MRAEESTLKTLKRVFQYINLSKKKMLAVSACLLISTIIGFFEPLVVRRITDEGMAQGNIQLIFVSVCILIGLVFMRQLLEVLQSTIFVDIHNESILSLFRRVFDHLMRLKLEYFTDKNNTEIVQSMQMDVNNVCSLTDRAFVSNATHLFRIFSGLAGLLVISWKLTLVVLMVVPIKYVLVRTLAKKREGKTKAWIERHRDFSAWFGDIVDGIKEIKLWNLYVKSDGTFEEKFGQVLRHSKESAILDAWNIFFGYVLEWIVMGALYVLGGILIVQGTLTIGGVFAFLSYSSYVTGPITSILNLRYYLSQVAPSAKRLLVFFTLDEESNPNRNILIEKEKITIQYNHVSFCYQDGKKVLSDINLRVSQGEKVAIIGANGSGKTTLLNLMLRFHAPTEGEIYVNDVDSRDIETDAYRKLFSVVSQDPYLFFDTVYGNVNLDRKATREDVERAFMQSGVNTFLAKMPTLENQMIGRNGTRLSGGERQKLAVARAVVKNAPIVILDEATSGFDTLSDADLHHVLLNELAEKTVIMITHRYEHLHKMDKVYQLLDGSLQEFPILCKVKNC